MRNDRFVTVLLIAALSPWAWPLGSAAERPVRHADAPRARAAPFRPSSGGFAILNRKKGDDGLTAVLRAAGLTGTCGGFAFGAVDYYVHGEPPPTGERLERANAPLRPLSLFLFRRHVTSLARNGWRFVAWTLLPDADEGRFPGVGSLTRGRELGRLESALEDGPVPLGLVGSRDLGHLEHNHQVVAYGLERLGTTVLVRLYDPNLERAEGVVLALDESDPSAPVVQVLGGTVVGEWRGFFVESYEPVRPPA